MSATNSLVRPQKLFLLVLIATVLGSSMDALVGNKVDYWIHDAALVYQVRTTWKYTSIVVLDDAVPVQVGRKQALPLFARASEKLVDAGVKGIFLDANIPKKIEGTMPYALCIESNGDVRWSEPSCLLGAKNQCHVGSSLAGRAPLKMANNVFPLFKVAPYLESANLPDFLLYDLEAEAFIPKTGLVALDRLIGKDSAVARWMDLSEEHAVISLAKFIDPQWVEHSLSQEGRETCGQDLPCRRIRFSRPVYRTQYSSKQPILPVSKLASCDDTIALQAAAALKNRVVILQLTTPNEATDVIITPFTTALLGPHLLTPGAQYLADAVETLLTDDYPREPHALVKPLIFILAAFLGVFASVYLKQQSWLWLIGFFVLLSMGALCFLSPVTQLWPVTVTLLTYIAGALEGIAIHLFIGFKEGNLIIQYMPPQVHNLLLTLKENETFKNQRYQAIVLMSDVTGYTTVTSILKEPAHILELMNDYLNETSYVLQEQYEGWLETYIGDMVCYYWPFRGDNQQAYWNAMKGAIELAILQKRFFTELPERYRSKFDPAALEKISHIINAGIGLSVGTVVMGDLGPKRGVRKFGIIGDPMNLSARIESLTRYFNAEIIVTADLLSTAKTLGYPARRLGYFRVKGRDNPEMLYGIGSRDDIRFTVELVEAWEKWLVSVEQGSKTTTYCPDVFKLDQSSLNKWLARGLLKNGIWYLEEK
jgi:adenylate cyclase